MCAAVTELQQLLVISDAARQSLQHTVQHPPAVSAHNSPRVDKLESMLAEASQMLTQSRNMAQQQEPARPDEKQLELQQQLAQQGRQIALLEVALTEAQAHQRIRDEADESVGQSDAQQQQQQLQLLVVEQGARGITVLGAEV